MNMLHKPGIKYLIKINTLINFFNETISNKDHNSAFNILYKMRIIHGLLMRRVVKMSKKGKSVKKCFEISCMYSIIQIINEKIITSEITFNTYITNNNIDPSTLTITIPEEKSIKSSSSEKSEKSSSKKSKKSKKSQKLNIPIDIPLPLFDGNKSQDTILRENIGNEIISKSINDFDKSLPSLLFFYNPGCPACFATKPHWDSLIEKLKQSFINDKLFNIMEIDVSNPSNEKLASLFKVEFIPTLIMMESSNKPLAKIEKIEGKADRNKIQKFIKESYSKFVKN